MTGDIFDIKRFAIHDGPGIRTTVFFSGCPLDCWWCHNPEGIGKVKSDAMLGMIRKKSPPYVAENNRTIGPDVSVDALIREIERDRVFYQQSGGGVTFSGGEPFEQPIFLFECLKKCKDSDIDTVIDTCGCASWTDIEKTVEFTDLYLYDLKLSDEEDHIKYTGVSKGRIVENLSRLSEAGAQIWVRLPLVPGITDTEANIDSIVEVAVKYGTIKKVCILPYNRFGEDKARRLGIEYRPGRLAAHDPEDIDRIKNRITDAGLDVSVGG